jgi:hypothetical protein
MEFETTLINSSIYPLARVISMLCSSYYEVQYSTGLLTADHRTQRIDSSKLSHCNPPCNPLKITVLVRSAPAASTERSQLPTEGPMPRANGGGVPRRVHAALRQDQESNNDQRKL